VPHELLHHPDIRAAPQEPCRVGVRHRWIAPSTPTEVNDRDEKWLIVVA
jgi:hypothetical protein